MDVSQYTSRAMLDSVRSFHGCSYNFLDDLAVAIRERTLPPSTFLFRVHDAAKARARARGGAGVSTAREPV